MFTYFPDPEVKTRTELTNFADKFEEFQRNEKRSAGEDLQSCGLVSMNASTNPDQEQSGLVAGPNFKEDMDKARAKELKVKRKDQKRREKERWSAMNKEEKKEAKKQRLGQKYPTSMFNQYITLVERSYIDAYRSPDFIFNRLVKPHVIGFIIWTIYFQLSYSPAAVCFSFSHSFFVCFLFLLLLASSSFLFCCLLN
jgi:hypothetical protein